VPITLLWEETELHGLVIETEERFEQTLTTMRTLRRASTWGEVRTVELAPWARQLLEQHEEYLADEGEVPANETRWDYDDISESVVEVIPLPHDAEQTRRWLGTELLDAHADVGGASPGGNIDGYRIRDQDAFLDALREAGYEPEHRPGLLEQIYNA